MADGNIRLPQDATGKRLQTFENTVDGVPVHAEGVVLVDPTTGAANSSTLTARMLRKEPAVGYRLWFDTADGNHTYIAEAPAGAAEADAVFRGIRITKVDGKAVGPVQERSGFAWTDRTGAGWS